MAAFPKDQFDDLPEHLDRVGAHRGPKVKGRGWIGFAWAALATGVIVLASLYALSRLNDFQFTLPGAASSSAATTPTAKPTTAIVPVTDPTKIKARKITITVLNGTTTTGLEKQAAAILKKAKWTIGATALASESTIKKTVIYYSVQSNADVAQGVELALGTGSIRFSSAFQGAPITVVLGSDFQG
ncbi:LytR C-terminal domain-containing protein [Galbitalea soli]|uniref:LytR C-terminal domain-containing protein n=1 Tax=Galbitalea soli TaxID=1268042 RepID=A0A7C9TRX4_9MICO|nr:LytR C-terminal domain-containing protein [Galbitalea soli]NEM92378.1 LytR C-terminal domain-containing protein [Galbitalea soli]NYJ31665.1 energy-converting hydrogenase Eha subunit F [Galbitalea soli]